MSCAACAGAMSTSRRACCTFSNAPTTGATMDLPKSSAGEREVPFGKIVANTLREHRLRSSYSADSDLVFCSNRGTVLNDPT